MQAPDKAAIVRLCRTDALVRADKCCGSLTAPPQFCYTETWGNGCKSMARKPIQAAGGIVVRKGDARPLFAVVQRSKDDRWVLPRGKLKVTERPVNAARREVFEETGHRVTVHEFLGAITYRARGRPKLVQFWHMAAAAHPSRDLMPDIARVAWLPLGHAVERLSYPLEKLFLQSIGVGLVRRRRAAVRRGTKPQHKARTGSGRKPKKAQRKARL